MVVTPDVLASTAYVPTALDGGVLVKVAFADTPGASVSDAGERLDIQPASDGSDEVSAKPLDAQAIESLFFTVTVKLTGDPAFTDVLVGEIEIVGAAAVHGGVL